jgi:hypothetical protein
VEFYYSSKETPGQQFYNDNPKTLELLEQLKAKGVDVKVTDLASLSSSIFMTYNAAVTGPKADKRSVFGAKGALEPEFGKIVPALLLFIKDDRYPEEVFPRMDRELQRLVPCSEAAANLLKT